MARRTAEEVAQIRDLIYELVDGLNTSDPSICTRLFSQHLLKREDRPPIVALCERSAAETRSEVELHQIEAIDIRTEDGATGAFVRFVLESDGKLVRYLFRLTRSGSVYLIDAALPVEQPK